jgi:flagellin-like protein
MRRKAVSPVIATLLLIVIAVAAAVLTYIWVTGYMGSVAQQASTAQLQERIKIEGVKYNTTGVFVYVRNIGDAKVQISSFYLYDASGTVVATVTLTSPQELNPGDVKELPPATTPLSYTLSPGATYIVKVVTVKGTETAYTFTYRT